MFRGCRAGEVQQKGFDADGATDVTGDNDGVSVESDATSGGTKPGAPSTDGAPQPKTRVLEIGDPRAEFECPCAENIDCLSGFCVEGPDGTICTEACLLNVRWLLRQEWQSGPGCCVYLCSDAPSFASPAPSIPSAGVVGVAQYDNGFYCTQIARKPMSGWVCVRRK